jgi:hypothetical protein
MVKACGGQSGLATQGREACLGRIVRCDRPPAIGEGAWVPRPRGRRYADPSAGARLNRSRGRARPAARLRRRPAGAPTGARSASSCGRPSALLSQSCAIAMRRGRSSTFWQSSASCNSRAACLRWNAMRSCVSAAFPEMACFSSDSISSRIKGSSVPREKLRHQQSLDESRHRRRIRVLDLDPVGRSSGPVGTIAALGDHALEAHRAGRREHRRAVAVHRRR